MKDSFGKLNPFVNFTFFLAVILLTAFTQNPVCTAISFVCALINAFYYGGKAVLKMLVWLLPMGAFVALINPIFNHEGATILTYFSWGNPLTLESLIYGIVTAVLLVSAVLWFSCFNRVMTSDKFVYIFGRLAPALSLVLSMTLRFVPRFTAQLKRVRQSQKCIGRDMSNGSLVQRIKNGIKILSIMITWALENAIDTADSMKGRGYGLRGRTAYSIYKFTLRDLVCIGVILSLCAVGIVGTVLRLSRFRYFPILGKNLFSEYSVICYVGYMCLMLLPIIINISEGAKWKRSKSKI